MKVPGTFKNIPVLRKSVVSGEALMVKRNLVQMGAKSVDFWKCGDCGVIVSREPISQVGYRWHLSISHPTRYPTWDEIKTARYGIPALSKIELMAQLLPVIEDDRDWTNLHENCFHLYEIHDPTILLDHT